MIPEDWPITLVQQFLMRTVRKTQHQTRTKHIEKALAQGKSLQVQATATLLQRQNEVVTEDR